MILLAYNHAVWGGYNIFGSGYAEPGSASEHHIGAFLIGVLGALASPERGLLVMTPALLLLLPGVAAGWRAGPWWVRSGALAGASYLVVQLWSSRFPGGDGFYSYRTTLEGLSLGVPLLGLAWREWTARTNARRTAFAALAVLSVAVHAFGAVVHWVPAGQHSPWTTFLPYELARHIGPAATTGWIAGALVVIAAVTASVGQQRRSVSAAGPRAWPPRRPRSTRARPRPAPPCPSPAPSRDL